MLSREEYDLEMRLTKVYKNHSDWQRLTEYNEKYICKGAILKIFNFSDNEKCTKLLFAESQEEDVSLYLIILTGNKSGTIWVRLPIEAYYKNTRLISYEWIIKNYHYWIALDTDLNKTEIIYQLSC